MGLAWLLMTLLGASFLAGISAVGIRRASGQPAGYAALYGHLLPTTSVLGAGLLIGLITVALGELAEHLVKEFGIYGWFGYLPLIYLQTAYLLVIPLIVDRQLGIWQAMEASRKTISQRWFKVFFLYLILLLVVAFLVNEFRGSLRGLMRVQNVYLALLPIGIGLLLVKIISIIAMSFGVLYRTIFDAAPK